MAYALLALLVAPALAAVVSVFLPRWAVEALAVVVGGGSFAVAIILVGNPRVDALNGWLSVDALAVVFLLAVSFLYFLTMVFTIGYLRAEDQSTETWRRGRLLFVGLHLFCWAMLVAPLMSSLALLWVAIEVTTVVSALLVAIDGTKRASEAAWKYVLIASMGLGIALLGTVVLYYAGSAVLGTHYDLFFTQVLRAAHRLPPQVVRLADVLAVVGFGTKVGWVPMHTWLPDAHSEAPTPVSTLLSGALLAVSFYAVLRYFEITESAVGAGFPRAVLLGFGLASLLLAALSVAGQRDVKRLLAYSSIEHMGILAVGMSFGATVAVAGVLLQVLGHAAAKGTSFFGAGTLLRRFGTKDLGRIKGAISLLPRSGPMLVLALLGLSGLPPFGIFRSELMIVEGGLLDPDGSAVVVVVVLVLLAFAGLLWTTGRALLSPAARPRPARASEPSRWMAGAMFLGLVGLAVLGVHPPEQLLVLLDHAARQLGAGR